MAAKVEVEVIVEDDRWTALNLPDLATRACTAAFSQIGLSGAFSVSLLAADDAKIADLNGQFRAKAAPTNVLSWPSEDLAPATPGDTPVVPSDPEIGDIALAYETCMREAAQYDIEVHDHVTHLVLHGCLHLLGYDHVTDADATVMETLEIEALEKLGIKNPYS